MGAFIDIDDKTADMAEDIKALQRIKQRANSVNAQAAAHIGTAIVELEDELAQRLLRKLVK